MSRWKELEDRIDKRTAERRSKRDAAKSELIGHFGPEIGDIVFTLTYEVPKTHRINPEERSEWISTMLDSITEAPDQAGMRLRAVLEAIEIRALNAERIFSRRRSDPPLMVKPSISEE